MLMSRYLPGVSECVPWPACELRDGPRLAASQVRGRRRIQVIRHRVEAGRDGIAAIPDFIGRAVAGRCYRSSSARGSRGYHAATTHDGRPKTTARVRPGPRSVTGRACSPGATAGGGNRRLGLALLVIATAQLMVVLATIVNVALPPWSLVTRPSSP